MSFFHYDSPIQLCLNQLPNELKPAFEELKVMKHLQQAGFRKQFGFSCARLQIVFVLLLAITAAGHFEPDTMPRKKYIRG
jgi:hypothetical protein